MSDGSGSITLVLGGVRSGKSRFAQDLVAAVGGEQVTFVATAHAGDQEMSDRIEHHQQSRPASWTTIESPLNVGRRLAAVEQLSPVVLLDCLTLLVSNVLCQPDCPEDQELCQQQVLDEVNALIQVAQQRSLHLVIVSGEVGSGIVPEHRLGRLFRDLLGFANQHLAAVSDRVYLLVAGQAIDVKQIGVSVEDAARQVAPLKVQS
ncbi:MAG: bifunctional adenosylcobinamide kinase/adenosylcobinamide-phosphate guanylyltransferase [Rhodopirellula sp. TMED11]|nr:MAG: bifunctional adenosylcobinamide kinase/adenosylcobinamide-phosphate guanylyltransferase [Rhodopirellula sp. TMED11]